MVSKRKMIDYDNDDDADDDCDDDADKKEEIGDDGEDE